MIQAFIILGIVTLLSYLSQRHQQENGMENMRWDIYLIILTIFLILMFGLRKSYNDSLLSSKLQKNMSEKWLLLKMATFFDCIEGSFL